MLEGLLWVTGYRPYRYQQFSIESSPHQNIVADTEYGLALNPGAYTITINEGLTYHTTHINRFSRVIATPPTEEPQAVLAVFGCSYTYGMGLDDADAFPSHLANRLSDYEVRSYAVPGYGTVQGFMQLHQLVEQGEKPQVALFNFADFHLDRNSMTPDYRLHLNVGYQMAIGNDRVDMAESAFPYVREQDGTLVFHKAPWSQLYQHWSGRETFALVNLLQTITDRYETASIDAVKNTVLLMEQIQSYCTAHDIRLVVAGITESQATAAVLEAVSNKGIETVDAGLPLESATYNNLPYDTHPNERAHRLMAEKMGLYLTKPQHTATR